MQCLQCGQEFIKIRQSGKHAKRKFCSGACSAMYSRGMRGIPRFVPRMLPCHFCQATFTQQMKAQIFCSQSCGEKFRRKHGTRPLKGPFICQHCGSEFFTTRGMQRGKHAGEGTLFCSRACSNLHQARLMALPCSCQHCGRSLLRNQVYNGYCLACVEFSPPAVREALSAHKKALARKKCPICSTWRKLTTTLRLACPRCDDLGDEPSTRNLLGLFLSSPTLVTGREGTTACVSNHPPSDVVALDRERTRG